MPVSYNSNKIIPAPFVDISKSYLRSNDGTKIGATFTITLSSKLVAYKGSPTSTGTFWTNTGYPPDETIVSDSRLAAILHKQEALRNLFSTDGLLLEIQPLDGTTPMTCNPRVISITFSQGPWFDTCDYTIELEADCIIGLINPDCEDSFTEFISSAEENWSLEFNEQAENIDLHSTYRLTHTISAVGKRHFLEDTSLEKDAWKQARDWVQARLGIDNDRITGAGSLDLPGYYAARNHIRSENLDEFNGSYSVTESWLIASGVALEEFNIETRTSAEDGLTNVSINGTITGLETRDGNFAITQSKWEAAQYQWTAVSGDIFNRAQTYSGTSLNIIALSSSVGKNPVTGNISFAYEYNDRPSNCIENAISEVISVNNDNQADVIAELAAPGRIAGPILQDASTKTAKRRTLSIEVVMAPVPGCTTAALLSTGQPDVSDIITAVQPDASQLYKVQDTDSWIPHTGRYSRNITWTYEV